MNPHTQTALAEMVARGVTFDALADYDAIREIDDLASDLMGKARSAAYLAALQPSTRAGNRTFYPLTIGGKEFLDLHASAWYEDQIERGNMAFAFILASRDSLEGIWTHAGDRRGFDRALSAWMRTTSATAREITKAMKDLRAVEEINDLEQTRLDADMQQGADGDNGWLIETLVSQYGQDAHYWIWKAPIDQITMLMDSYQARAEAELRAMSHAQGSAIAPNPDSKQIQALRKFRDACERLEAVKKGGTK